MIESTQKIAIDFDKDSTQEKILKFEKLIGYITRRTLDFNSMSNR